MCVPMTAELASLLPSGDARHANRLSSLVGALPLSCELLKPQLAELVDRYWENTPMADLQALPAGLAFARYLDLEIRAGRVVNRFAIDVLRYERAWLELQLCTHTGSSRDGDELVRELAFEFDPRPLFEALASGKPVPEMLPDRPTTIDFDFRSDPPQTRFHHPVVKSPNDADQVNEMP